MWHSNTKLYTRCQRHTGATDIDEIFIHTVHECTEAKKGCDGKFFNAVIWE